MIDNVKLYIEAELNVDLILSSNPQQFRTKRSNNYRIFNSEGNHSLQIVKGKGGYYLTGSWRKWFHGEGTIKDLSRAEIFYCNQMISAILCISTELLLNAKVIKMEFGLNFNLPIKPRALIYAMYQYSNVKAFGDDKYRRFALNDYWLIVYDKGHEVLQNNSLKNEVEIDSLRIELKLFRRTAFISKMRSIYTLAELLNDYRNLIISLYHEIKRIEIHYTKANLNDIDFTNKAINYYNDYKYYVFAVSVGLSRVFNFIKELDMKNSGKSVQRKKIKVVLAKFEQKPEFGRDDFLKSCRLQLVDRLAEANPLIV